MTRPLTSWLADNQQRLAVRFHRLTPFEKWHAGWFGAAVEIVVGGRPYLGNAFARTLDLAVEKASAEAIERATYSAEALAGRVPSGMSTSGFAAHVHERDARANARRELIERDAFLCHFIGRVPLETMRTPSTALVTSLLRRLRRIGISVRFGKLRTPRDCPAVLCIADGAKHERPFGIMIGLGNAPTTSAAVNHAMLECFMGLMSTLSGRVVTHLTAAEFLRRRSASLEAHVAAALHPKTSARASILFSPAVARRRRVRVPGRFTFHRVALPPALTDCPAFVVRCENTALQPLFFGVTTKAVLNDARLRSFRDEAGCVTAARWNLQPHPMW